MLNLIVHALGTAVIGYVLGVSGKEPSVMVWAVMLLILSYVVIAAISDSRRDDSESE